MAAKRTGTTTKRRKQPRKPGAKRKPTAKGRAAAAAAEAPAAKRRSTAAAKPGPRRATSRAKAAAGARRRSTAGRKATASAKRRPGAAKTRRPSSRAGRREELLHICHDRILPRDMARPQRTRRAAAGPDRLEAIVEFRKLWINGSTLHVRFIGGTAQQRANARQAAVTWSRHANLTFVFDDAPDADIRIAFDDTDGAWSFIGTDCSDIPQGDPTMNLGFEEGGTALHEFGHAIGFVHEHQNPDGGIVWNEPRVIQSLSGPPNRWTPAQIRRNVLEKYQVDQIRGTKFDSDSIMLYFFPGAWVQSGIGTKANSVLSKTDIAFVKSSEAYPPTAAGALPLAINGGVQSAGIGQPGEEDLFSFTVTQPGRHVVETGGETDVVLKLFGPDSQTSMIAEDDDSGPGFNARISADLLAGQYFAQVRHFNQSGGTGSYTIGVRR